MQVVFWIVICLLPVAASLWVYRADRQRVVPMPWLTAALRGVVVLLGLLLLLAPLLTVDNKASQKPIVLFLQDNSASIPLALKADTAAYKQQAAGLLHKLSSDYKFIKWGFGNTIQPDTLFSYTQQATDISSALSQAIERYGEQNIGAVILATDGRYNQGINPQFQDVAYQGAFYTVALGDSVMQKDIRVSAVYANKTVSLNNQFEIRADIVARYCNGYNKPIQLLEVGGEGAANMPLNVNSEQYSRSVSFTLKAARAGLHHYRITAPVADGEQNTVNNIKDVFVEVVNEQKRVLIAAAAPHPDVQAIRAALAGLEGYTVSVKMGADIPSSFDEYDIIVLHSLPSTGRLMSAQALAQKPVWFIVGYGASNPLLNEMQKAVRLNVNTQNLQNLFAIPNAAFATFTLPQTLNAVADKLPPLAVPAGTITESPNAINIFSAKGNNNMPLWALQEGMPPKALLIGEGLWRWRLSEYRHFNTHDAIDELIRQTISFLGANAREKPFQVTLPKYVWNDREAVTMNAWMLNANNEQVNNSEVNITITDSAGHKQDYSFEKQGNAYKLNIGLRESGNYAYTAKTNYNGTAYTAQGRFSVQHIQLEAMETGADYPLLYALSRKNNGSLISYKQVASLYDSIRHNPNIKPVITVNTEHVPLIDWKWYFLFILVFAVAEWLLRKYWMAQ